MSKVVQVFEQNEYIFSDGIKRIVPIQLWPIDKSSYKRKRIVFKDNTTNYRIVSNVETVLKPYEYSPKDIKPKIEVKSEYDIKPKIKCESKAEIKPLVKIEPKYEDKEDLKDLLKTKIVIKEEQLSPKKSAQHSSPNKSTEQSSDQTTEPITETLKRPISSEELVSNKKSCSAIEEPITESLKRPISSEELVPNKKSCSAIEEITISDSETEIEINGFDGFDGSDDTEIDLGSDLDETTQLSKDGTDQTVPIVLSEQNGNDSDDVNPPRSKWVTPPTITRQLVLQKPQSDSDESTEQSEEGSNPSPAKSLSADETDDTDQSTPPRTRSGSVRKKPSKNTRRTRSSVSGRKPKPKPSSGRKLRSATKKTRKTDTDESDSDADNEMKDFIVTDESEDSDDTDSDDDTDESLPTPEESDNDILPDDDDLDDDEDNSDEPDETDSGTDEFEYSLEKRQQRRDNTQQNPIECDILLPTDDLNHSTEQSIDETDDNYLSDELLISDSDDSVPSQPLQVNDVSDHKQNSRTKVFEIILSYLSFEDKLKLESVCKQWQQIIIRQQKKLVLRFERRMSGKWNVFKPKFVLFLGNDIKFFNFTTVEFISISEKLISKFVHLTDIQLFTKDKFNINSIVQTINDNTEKLDNIRLLGAISTDCLIRFGLLFGSGLKTVDINSGDLKLTKEQLMETNLLSNNLKTLYVFKSVKSLLYKQLPQLRELLDMNNNDIVGLRTVADCYQKQITKISFRVKEYLKEYWKVTESLRQLSRFQCLEYLDFYFANNILTHEFKTIENLRHSLKELHVFGSNSHLNLKHLSRFTQLEVLGLFFDCPAGKSLNFSALHSLDLTELWMYCDITVDELEKLLNAMENLKTLHLISNYCYEKEISDIIGWKTNLRTIYLEDTLITVSIVKEMMSKAKNNPYIHYSLISDVYADPNHSHECYRVSNPDLPKNMTVIIHRSSDDPFVKLDKIKAMAEYFEKEEQLRKRRMKASKQRVAPDPQQFSV